MRRPLCETCVNPACRRSLREQLGCAAHLNRWRAEMGADPAPPPALAIASALMLAELARRLIRVYREVYRHARPDA